MTSGKQRHSDTLCGYFLPFRQELDANSDEDDSDYGGDDDIQLGNDDDMAPTLSGSKVRPPKRAIVSFKAYQRKDAVTVEGSFQYWDPWWAATLKVVKSKWKAANYKMLGYPSYSMRTDKEMAAQGIIPLFMTKYHVPEQHKQLFLQFVKESGNEPNLDFEHLPDILESYAKISEETAAIKQSIWAFLSPHIEALQRVADVKLCYELLPQLLPRKFAKVASIKHILPDLEMTLQTQPWAFCFSSVMAHLHQLAVECQMDNFMMSGLMDTTDPVIQGAIVIYTGLKDLCYQGGHTYNRENFVKTCHTVTNNKQYLVDWESSMEFLCEKQVVKREESSDGWRIYLKQLWTAENKIAVYFKSLWSNHKQNPWTFDIDFSRKGFDKIASDADQKHAAEMIGQKPVIVISGKGGCGKTQVVSTVYRDMLNLLLTNAEKRKQVAEFWASDVDDILLTQSCNEFEQTYCNTNLDLLDSSMLDPHQVSDGEVKSVPEELSNATAEDNITNLTKISDEELGRLRIGALHSEPCEEEPFEYQQDEDKPIILLTAPTGKAGNLLGRRAKTKGFTLHQIIFSYKAFKNTAPPIDGEQKPWRFCNVEVLVVDECSLVSVTTFHQVLKPLIEDAKLKRVILLGDINQLPSIEPGNFLSDTYRSLQHFDCAVALTTNHRSDSKLIVNNATRIAERNLPIISPERHFHQINLPEQNPGSDDYVDNDQHCEVEKLLKDENFLIGGTKMDHCSQFVAFRRKDCDGINEACCKHYSKHPTRGSDRKLCFQIGDKVCCTKNASVKDHNNKKEIRLCNGEIFFIVEDVTITEDGGNKPKKVRYLELLDPDPDAPRQIKVDFKSLNNMCKLRHAWARTIHTYQGSEADTVIYVVGNPYFQTWQHVYTAVTRGRKCVIILTRQSHLAKSVATPPKRRFTSLQERLDEQLKGFRPEYRQNVIPPVPRVHPLSQMSSAASNFSGSPQPKRTFNKCKIVPVISTSSSNHATSTKTVHASGNDMIVPQSSVTKMVPRNPGSVQMLNLPWAPGDQGRTDTSGIIPDDSRFFANSQDTPLHLLNTPTKSVGTVVIPQSVGVSDAVSEPLTNHVTATSTVDTSTFNSSISAPTTRAPSSHLQHVSRSLFSPNDSAIVRPAPQKGRKESDFNGGVLSETLNEIFEDFMSSDEEEGFRGHAKSKRSAEDELPKDSTYPRKRNPPSEGPVTDATVSPMRRVLEGFKL